MSGASQEPWHGNPNAPKISSQVYFNEKTKFAGMVTCAIFYGTQTDASTYPSSPLLFNPLS